MTVTNMGKKKNIPRLKIGTPIKMLILSKKGKEEKGLV
jgi:hypothetical protein